MVDRWDLFIAGGDGDLGDVQGTVSGDAIEYFRYTDRSRFRCHHSYAAFISLSPD